MATAPNITSEIWKFIKTYYIDSIVYKQGYNPVNTATWAIILVIAVYLLYRFLERRFDFDEKFIFSNIPFVILGSSVRIIEDSGILQPPFSYLFMSPLIYFMIFFITFPSLLLTARIFKKDYYKYHAAFGIVLSLIVLVFLFTSLKIINEWVLPAGIVIAVAFTIVASFTLPRVMRNQITLAAFFSQLLDGFETYFGVEYLNYAEMHVIPKLLIEKIGTFSFPLLKLAIFVGILYLIDTSEESQRLKNFIKFVIIVLGLAPGLRDGLRMTFGV